MQSTDKKGEVSEIWGVKREPHGAHNIGMADVIDEHINFLDTWEAEDWIAHFAPEVINTRYQKSSKPSRIDHIYVSKPKLYADGRVDGTSRFRS